MTFPSEFDLDDTFSTISGQNLFAVGINTSFTRQGQTVILDGCSNYEDATSNWAVITLTQLRNTESLRDSDDITIEFYAMDGSQEYLTTTGTMKLFASSLSAGDVTNASITVESIEVQSTTSVRISLQLASNLPADHKL